MDQFSRRIVGFGVQAVAVDGPALCRMFNQAISGQGLPTRLSADHDPLFRFHRWQANLRILGVETVQTVPQVPWSHPFIERLIATIRREYLDRLFFGLQMTWNESWNCSETTTTRRVYTKAYPATRPGRKRAAQPLNPIRSKFSCSFAIVESQQASQPLARLDVASGFTDSVRWLWKENHIPFPLMVSFTVVMKNVMR